MLSWQYFFVHVAESESISCNKIEEYERGLIALEAACRAVEAAVVDILAAERWQETSLGQYMHLTYRP